MLVTLTYFDYLSQSLHPATKSVLCQDFNALGPSDSGGGFIFEGCVRTRWLGAFMQ